MLLPALLVGAQALAQATDGYPSRPLTWIVPDGPGGVADLRARQIAPRLSAELGQAVVVDNRPGGNQVIAAQAAARAAADGYTLFLGNVASQSMNPLVFRTLPYRADEDFIPVTLISAAPLVMTVNADIPARTLAELIELDKSRPGQLAYGAGGQATPPHLIMEQIKARTGAGFLFVPYKATGDMIKDLVAGRVAVGLNYWAVLDPQIKSGKLRALAVAGPRRLAVARDIPTFAEAGMEGIDGYGWQGIFVPAGTPKTVVARLQEAVARVMKLPEVRDPIIDTGAEVGGNSTEEFADFVSRDREKWKRLVEQAGITPQ